MQNNERFMPLLSATKTVKGAVVIHWVVIRCDIIWTSDDDDMMGGRHGLWTNDGTQVVASE